LPPPYSMTFRFPFRLTLRSVPFDHKWVFTWVPALPPCLSSSTRPDPCSLPYYPTRFSETLPVCLPKHQPPQAPSPLWSGRSSKHLTHSFLILLGTLPFEGFSSGHGIQVRVNTEERCPRDPRQLWWPPVFSPFTDPLLLNIPSVRAQL
jgi:hypothetical protein